jgi:hypothetical protein
MGSITRSFANNITTSGVLLPASLTNNSISNVTAYNAAIATGNMVLISSQTASNSASISFTTGINSTYKEYQFYFIDIDSKSEPGNFFNFNLSTDGGSNYNVTKTSSSFRYYHTEDDSGTGLAYDTGTDLSQSTSNQVIGGSVGTDADQSLSGSLTLFNPSSTTYVKHFIATANVNREDDICMGHRIAGYGNTTSAINAIRFQFDTGNMDGTILMYGIV